MTGQLAPGVWGVLATPFDADDQVDPLALRRQVSHYARIGATGLTVLGVFGEAARLSTAERRTVAQVVAEANGELPLVIGASALATAPLVEEVGASLSAVTEVGRSVDAVMVQVNSVNPDQVVEHFRTVQRETGAALVVQDYPAASGVRIASGDLVSVVRRVDGVVAVKSESSPSPPAVATLVADCGVPVFGGLGGTCLLDELAVGAAGAMTGFSVPEGLVACVRAYQTGGLDAAREAWLPYLPLVNFEFQPGVALRLRKQSLWLRGLIDHAGVRPPAPAVPERLLELVSWHLERTPHGTTRT